MLYDSRWDRSFDPPPPGGGGDRSWFLVVLIVPVLILGATAAGAFGDIRLLLAPLAVNIVGCLWSLARDRA